MLRVFASVVVLQCLIVLSQGSPDYDDAGDGDDAGSCKLDGQTWKCGGDAVQGFGGLTDRLKEVYPYTSWRGVDWDSVKGKYGQRLGAMSGLPEFIRIIMDFREELHDGHVDVEWNDEKDECHPNPTEDAKKADIGVGYGALFGKADDGNVHVTYVVPGAAVGNLKVGDEVKEVCRSGSCKPVLDALSDVSLRWAETAPATTAAIEAERLRFLSRGATDSDGLQLKLGDGSTVDLAGSQSEKGSLRYTLPLTIMPTKKPTNCINSGNFFGSRIIPEASGKAKQGYIAIPTFAGCIGFDSKVGEHIANFKDEDVKGIIIDLRGNGGGDDENVPSLLSYFYDKSYQYEQTVMKPKLAAAMGESGKDVNGWTVTGKYVVKPKPQDKRWTGQVTVLVNRGVMSNGDMASFLFKRIGAKIVGFEGTSGSASMAGGKISMKCIDFDHTAAQSWNPKNEVQVEANKDREGGVSPTHPVKRTVANLLASTKFNYKALQKASTLPTDVVLEYARSLTPPTNDGDDDGALLAESEASVANVKNVKRHQTFLANSLMQDGSVRIQVADDDASELEEETKTIDEL